MNTLQTFSVTILIVGVALLSSCATQPKSISKLPPETPMNEGAGNGDLLLVTLGMDGGDELLFMMDTGSPFTILDYELTPKLGKQIGSSFQITSDLYGKTTSHAYKAPDLYWGDVRLQTGRWVRTFDMKRLSADLTRYNQKNHKIMGILGMDCLQNYCVQLDFTKGKIRFLPPGDRHTEDFGNSFTLIPVSSGDQQGCFTLDSRKLVGVKEPHPLIDTGCVESDAKHPIGLDMFANHLVTFDFPKRTMYLKSKTNVR